MAKLTLIQTLIAFSVLAAQSASAVACPCQQLPSPTTLVNEFQTTPKVPASVVPVSATDSESDKGEYAVAPPGLFEDPTQWTERTDDPPFEEPVASFESTEYAPITLETVKAKPVIIPEHATEAPVSVEPPPNELLVTDPTDSFSVPVSQPKQELVAEPESIQVPVSPGPAVATPEPTLAIPEPTVAIPAATPEPVSAIVPTLEPAQPELTVPMFSPSPQPFDPAPQRAVVSDPASLAADPSFQSSGFQPPSLQSSGFQPQPFPSTSAGGFQEAQQFVNQPFPGESRPTFKSQPTVQHNFRTSPPQGTAATQHSTPVPWQATATPTPGHNERVNINRDLSLSPTAQPGQALRDYLPNQPPAFASVESLPNYDPRVGHRRAQPIRRANIYPLDDGEKFDFQKKKREFPPFNEIIATGRFFYMAEVLWAEPQFQGNTAIATQAPNFGESISNDFDSDFHPRVRLGFESQYGPGLELTYFNINSNSELASFTSDGVVTGQTSVGVTGRNVPSLITADAAGEILTSQHSIDIDSFTVSFFKELNFPISRVNGNFGFQYVSIAQQLNANVVSPGGATIETLQSTTDMRAYGPRAIIEYYRPIGHTPLELVTTFGGAVLFGQRDQRVTNSETGLENRLGADEFLTILDFLVAVQYKKTIGENRSVYGRFGFLNQTWLGGGSAVFPEGDFGLRGLTFGIGYNR